MTTPTLLCFPHAGAGSLFYERWRHLFNRTANLKIAQYPHRERLMHVPMPGSLETLVENLYTELSPDLNGKYAVWGHSMGSVIAYELTKRATTRLENPPMLFFTSGSSAPCDSTFRDPTALASDDGVEKILRRYGGIDDATLNNPQFMAYFRPIITADLCMLARYRDQAPTLLPCPVVMFQGEDDTVSIENWTRYTDRPIDLTYYPGGHFFITEHAQEIATAISSRLMTVHTTTTG